MCILRYDNANLVQLENVVLKRGILEKKIQVPFQLGEGQAKRTGMPFCECPWNQPFQQEIDVY